MTMAGRLLFVSLLIVGASARFGSAETDPQDIAVAVVIGTVRVPLNVRNHFPGVAKRLPRTGELPVADEHEKKHGARTYCYRFRAQSGWILLELFDSDFGLHSARISSVQSAPEGGCATVAAEPSVIVGELRYSVESPPRSAPLGFRSVARGDALVFEREWTYSDPARPHMWGTCFSREVSLTIEPAEGRLRRLTIDNWEEPGC